MGDPRPTVIPGMTLVAAAKRTQARAAADLLGTDAGGRTEPLPALQAAVALLAAADSKPGKVIYFVTDRAMLDPALTRPLQAPAAKNIVVMTYLVGDGGGNTADVLEKLASQSGGRFTRVVPPAKD